MDRRQGTLSLLLLLAALSSPIAGAARPLESSQLVVSISWTDEEAKVQLPPANAITFRAPAAADSVYPLIHSHSRSTALLPQLFQRPPPVVLRAL
jgi:hypothetical protein